MMLKSENTKNFFMVVTSNLLTIIVALFNGFIIPKQLGVTDYAYYRIYMLYIAYAGVTHLGFVNGIYLKYGSYNLDELPKGKFSGFGKMMLLLQVVIMALMSAVLFFARGNMDPNVVIAYAFIIVNIPLINIKWFYSSINQFTKRFVIDSYVTYGQNVMMLIMVVVIMVMHWYNFIVLLLFTTAINAICMIAVIVQNKTIVVAKSEKKIWEEGVTLIKSGFFLMVSEFVAIIILGIDSIFVQNLFSMEDFAMYSFAVSIISVIYSLISTVSNLIYPYLVRVEEEKYAEYYTLMSDILTVVSIFAMLAFFVAKFIVVTWLDKYSASISINAILFGTVIFRTLIMLVCGNYFKVLKMIKEYTKNNVFAIVISFITDLLAYLIFRDYTYIALASLLSFVIWYLVTDRIFIKRLQVPQGSCVRRYLCIAIGLALFYLIYQMDTIVAFFIYLFGAIIICVTCFFRQFQKLLQIVLEARKQKS